MSYPVLFETVVGSHAWGMQRPDSDLDINRCYQVPTRDILEGRTCYDALPQLNQIDQDGIKQDITRWEIGHLVNQLLKGNVNALWFVTSPVIVKDSTVLQDLRRITIETLSKEYYPSIRGMIRGQLKDIENSHPNTSKKQQTALKLIRFGYELFRNGEVVYRSVPFATELNSPAYNFTIQTELKWLDRVYEGSTLPEKVNPEPFRTFIYQLRVRNLEGLQ